MRSNTSGVVVSATVGWGEEDMGEVYQRYGLLATRPSLRCMEIFIHVKLAEDYSLLISSHKVGKTVHAFAVGRTMDRELWMYVFVCEVPSACSPSPPPAAKLPRRFRLCSGRKAERPILFDTVINPCGRPTWPVFGKLFCEGKTPRRETPVARRKNKLHGKELELNLENNSSLQPIGKFWKIGKDRSKNLQGFMTCCQ